MIKGDIVLLYDQVNSRLLLGALLLNPQILNNDKYKINKLDFKEKVK